MKEPPLFRLDIFPDGLRITVGEETLHLRLINQQPYPSIEIYKCPDPQLITLKPGQILDWPPT